MTRHHAQLVLAISALVGAVAGSLYAQHSIALAIARMKARYGWACGVGLDFPLYFWPVVGALLGLVVGRLALRYRQARVRRP